MPRKDPEARKAYLREYAAKNKEAAVARVRAWRIANPEKRIEQNKRYASKYPYKIVAKTVKYTSAKDKRTPVWLTDIDFERIETQYKLAAILTKLWGEPWHVDHIIPLRGKMVSGLHVPSNLQVIRGIENSRKNNKFEVV